MLKSSFTPLCEVSLPIPRGRQHYMHTFDLRNPDVPVGFEDYLPTIKSLCVAAGAFTGKAHITFDEKVVKAGMSQRRPGPHVDGCFVPFQGHWRHGTSDGGGAWLHNCNNISLTEHKRMPVIVAASQPGCKVWSGTFEGEPANDGDLSHIMDQLGDGETLPANHGFLLSADCVHESAIFQRDTPRTFLRIALPPDFGGMR